MAERSAARRRRGPEPIEDFEVGTSEGPRRLSSLFGAHDDLLLVHNMGRSCAYCTLWADGFVGLLPHLARRSAVALLTPDPPEVQRAFAASRGWPFAMASDPTRTVTRALGFATEAGSSLPGVSALRHARRDPRAGNRLSLARSSARTATSVRVRESPTAMATRRSWCARPILRPSARAQTPSWSCTSLAAVRTANRTSFATVVSFGLRR